MKSKIGYENLFDQASAAELNGRAAHPLQHVQVQPPLPHDTQNQGIQQADRFLDLNGMKFIPGDTCREAEL